MDFGTWLALVLILNKKSCRLGCFCASENLNRLPSGLLFIYLLLSFCFKIMSTSKEKIVVSMEEVLVVLRNLEQKNHVFYEYVIHL
jgi:hypothetical protein